MSEFDQATTEAPQPVSLLDPCQRMPLFLLAVVSPLVIWSFDFSLLSLEMSEWRSALQWSDWLKGGIYFLFVLQIGVLGWLVGRHIQTPLIRWAVYVVG